MCDKTLMIAHFWDEVKIGQEFRKNPHHVTLIPWFKCKSLDIFKEDLEKLLKHTKPIKYEIGPVKYLGKKKNIKASLINENKKLQNLHKKLLKLAKKYDSDLDDKYCGNTYKPHIAHKNKNHPKKGMKNTIDEIFIIEEIDFKSKLRKVIGKIDIWG